MCKDLWTLVFKKQVDNLKTNHRGVYVLTDNLFRPLARMSTDTGGQAVVRAQPVCLSSSFSLSLFAAIIISSSFKHYVSSLCVLRDGKEDFPFH